MGKLSFRAIIHKNKSSLDLGLQVYGLSTPRQQTTKTWPSKIYIATNIIDHGSDDDCTTYEKTHHNQDLGEEFITT